MVPMLGAALSVCARMSLRRLQCRSASLVLLGGVSLLVFSYLGPGSKSPTDGFASTNMMSGDLCPSTTPRAVVSPSSLCVTPVCDLTLPMCVVYPMLSLVCMMLSVSCRRCLWG